MVELRWVCPRSVGVALWALAGLLTLEGASSGVLAQSNRVASVAAATAPAKPAQTVSERRPLVAVVSLRGQTIEVFDADGSVARSKISSGRTDYETPTGVFSIIQKNIDHYSNLYDDAPMPFMQRLTWSGIALHAGALPGYPASHGCIRLPHAFAERLFSITQMGTRVIVMDSVARPVPVVHANLPAPLSNDPGTAPAARGPAPVRVASAGDVVPVSDGEAVASIPTVAAPALVLDGDAAADWPTGRHLDAARSEAASRLAKATRDAAAAKADLRRVQVETASALRAIRAAERALADAERRLVEAGDDRADARTERAAIQAEEAEIKAEADIAEARARIAAAAPRSAGAAALLAASEARAQDTEAERTALVRHVRLLERRARPISVFISRATSRLYVRRGFEPIGETAIEFKDPDQPVGTHVFTAMEASFEPASATWHAVTVVDPRGIEEPRGRSAKVTPPAPPRATSARAALDRVIMSDDIRREIAQHVRAGASLVISDERISSETGKGTDFVILTR